MPRVQVHSLIGELGSHKPYSAVKKQTNKQKTTPNLLEGLSYSPLPTQPFLAAILFPQFSRLPSQEERGYPSAPGLSLAYFGTWPLHVCSVAFSGLIPYLGIRELLGVLMDQTVQE